VRTEETRLVRGICSQRVNKIKEVVDEPNVHNELNQHTSKGSFTRREGCPSKRVDPSSRAKDNPGLQAKFHRYGNPTTRDNLCAVTLKGSGNNQKVSPGRRVSPTWSVYKGYPACHADRVTRLPG